MHFPSFTVAKNAFHPYKQRVTTKLAEGVGFEPTVRLPVRLISSQVPLTTQPPFQPFIIKHLHQPPSLCFLPVSLLYSPWFLTVQPESDAQTTAINETKPCPKTAGGARFLRCRIC